MANQDALISYDKEHKDKEHGMYLVGGDILYIWPIYKLYIMENMFLILNKISFSIAHIETVFRRI